MHLDVDSSKIVTVFGVGRKPTSLIFSQYTGVGMKLDENNTGVICVFRWHEIVMIIEIALEIEAMCIWPVVIVAFDAVEHEDGLNGQLSFS